MARNLYQFGIAQFTLVVTDTKFRSPDLEHKITAPGKQSAFPRLRRAFCRRNLGFEDAR